MTEEGILCGKGQVIEMCTAMYSESEPTLQGRTVSDFAILCIHHRLLLPLRSWNKTDVPICLHVYCFNSPLPTYTAPQLSESGQLFEAGGGVKGCSFVKCSIFLELLISLLVRIAARPKA
jgi:hypothetical protein